MVLSSSNFRVLSFGHNKVNWPWGGRKLLVLLGRLDLWMLWPTHQWPRENVVSQSESANGCCSSAAWPPGWRRAAQSSSQQDKLHVIELGIARHWLPPSRRWLQLQVGLHHSAGTVLFTRRGRTSKGLGNPFISCTPPSFIHENYPSLPRAPPLCSLAPPAPCGGNCLCIVWKPHK